MRVENMVLLVGVAGAILAGAPLAAGQVAVDVDCNAGDSIADALATPGEELLIRIDGFCEEDVQVRRDNVTFRGSSRFEDGFRPSPDADGEEIAFGTVIVRDARNIRFERLGWLDAVRNGLAVSNTSVVEIERCRFADGARGVAASTSYVPILDTQFENNSGFDAGAFDGALLDCTRCRFNNSLFPIFATRGGLATVTDSQMRGVVGPSACDGGSRVVVTGTTIEATEIGLWVEQGGLATVSDSVLSGAIWAFSGGLINLDTVTQTLVPTDPNLVGLGASVRALVDTTLAGSVFIDGFGVLAVQGGSSVDGGLFCATGGDAFCEDPLLINGGASGCDRCVTSASPVPAPASVRPERPEWLVLPEEP